MKKAGNILALFMMLFVLAASPVMGTHAEEDTDSKQTEDSDTVLNGWKGESYYLDGKAVNGWQKIDGYYYYFKKHIVQKNKIAGTKSSGQYYVGPDGIRVDDPVMNRAVTFVLKNSNASDSRYKRLKDCCEAIRNYYYYHMSSKAPEASEIPGCAEFMLKYHKGNCYRFATTMCYVATALGYKALVAAGGMTSYHYSNCLYRHGWCEIYSGGYWKIWDLSMQRKTSRKLVNVKFSDYPYRLRRLYRYKRTISKGKIKWKRVESSRTNTPIKLIK